MSGEPEYLARSTLAGRPLPFSSAVRIGDILYLSGQMGFRDDGALADGMQAQARQALENIRAVLDSAGLGFRDVFHCTVMLADMSQWSDFNAVYLEYFSDPLPTRSAFGASGLALGGLVELECQAFAGNR
ncbi:MAG TPA: RidA family protein [Sphingomicrobium sp.]|jgi:reactive intermediate/imine deaminase